ncbi:DEAD/DEAH box helicase [Candidatus Woesearchaeota archaeon]|nr:DEAD/DEAH box helicase [Candidatus Woesearchaeota archaeon]
MKENTSFKDLKLKSELERALTKQKYTIPTPIQLKSIPGLLLGKDLIGIAQTGTGKTAAFILPILHRMTEKYPRVINTLVLTPTRELASQIGESFFAYGEFLKFKHTVIFGGVGQGKQVQALSRGVNIVVATPGRLLDLMNQGKLNLRNIEFFVLDEADRMLDMGFIHDIKKIISKLPPNRQSLFFSATMSPQINELAKKLLKNPIHVEVTPQATTVERIKQYLYFVDQPEKERLLLELLKHEHLTSILIFTRTKHRADKVASFLSKNRISSDAIHGNKSQNARTRAIKDFKTGKTKVLVATDIAARGIDIDNISHVINFELPNEPESYVHRIGRTARAGTDGTAFSFCAAEERNYLRDIEKLTKQKIEVMEHAHHSETAKNAVGAAARPPPKKSFSRNSRFKQKSGFTSKNKKSFSKNYKSNRFKRSPKRR